MQTPALFFYPAVNLTLTEGAAPPEQMYFEASTTATSCTQECVSRGMSCDSAAQNALATGGLPAFTTNIAPNYPCDHMFAGCNIADPLVTNNQDCTYFDPLTCPVGVTPTSSCDAVLLLPATAIDSVLASQILATQAPAFMELAASTRLFPSSLHLRLLH